MAVSKIKAEFSCNLQWVWDTVTALDHYEWRSDLSKIEVINERQFIEYTKDGYATTFTVTEFKPCRRWEFDMENSNMKGYSGKVMKKCGLIYERTLKKADWRNR